MKIIVENKMISAIFFVLSVTFAIVTVEVTDRVSLGGAVASDDELNIGKPYKIEANSYYKKTSDLNSDVSFAPHVIEN